MSKKDQPCSLRHRAIVYRGSKVLKCVTTDRPGSNVVEPCGSILWFNVINVIIESEKNRKAVLLEVYDGLASPDGIS